jgi:NAD(P)-dependent dehydrogenase (short-subunit alcohol dehydrogenase family)
MAKHAVPHMPRGDAIVNVGSVSGAIDPIPGGYAISKRIRGFHLSQSSEVNSARSPVGKAHRRRS